MDGVMLCDMLRILSDNVDPIKIAVELQGLIVVKKGVYRRWRECNSRAEVLIKILIYANTYLLPQEFLSVLFKSGYTSVALQLSLKLCKQPVGLKTMEVNDSCDKLFYSFKTKAYNKILTPKNINSLLEIFHMSGEYKGYMRDANKRYVLCAGIDTILMSFF